MTVTRGRIFKSSKTKIFHVFIDVIIFYFLKFLLYKLCNAVRLFHSLISMVLLKLSGGGGGRVNVFCNTTCPLPNKTCNNNKMENSIYIKDIIHKVKIKSKKLKQSLNISRNYLRIKV